ncbi:type IV toxin-antitoxin system AbiEi family antitoxin domain-containing protein [Streptomyces sp. SID13031]|uniref:type IV toxin-antitoxin system AbiEi family antitoxin domain-containing protein n=1 Tax=Streptomyces sp. SID13031 TaxID=2706046 RepID=UPI0013CDA220|nr:type IV toxin-antitoxin system AbiEi family antitoxin domain-containing protein [Streptomyces sp. SID13031]NEA31836.1 type IV toxin-antitoxin system AbiEi family antitoxin domain-containing protein [Streptomyces sp. SID13031]
MKEVEKALPNTFTTRTAAGLGVHSRDLYAWRDDGRIVELSRGVFRRADAPAATYPDLLAVAHRSPGAVTCCISAAAVHDLTDELPVAVQIAVPRRSRTPRIEYPPTTAFRFDEDTFKLGLSQIEAAPGESVRVYSPTRTVVDLMRLRGRLGEPLAYSVLQRYLRSRAAKPGLLLDFAGKLDVYGPVRRALDVASAE